MYPIICHIFGPLYLHTYSICLALAIFLFLYLGYKDKKRSQLIDGDLFISLIVNSALAGIIGARILHIISQYNYYINNIFEILTIWDGGVSILGGFIGATAYIIYFTHSHSLQIFQILDFIVQYLPLSQAIGRIGCFFAGCCFGSESTVPWAIKYTNVQCVAPLNLYIHPTQLYSSLIFIVYFIVFNTILKKHYIKSGQLTSLYLIAIAFERFFIDFLRGDRILSYTNITTLLSFHQILSLGIAFAGIVCFVYSTYKHRLKSLFT